MLLAVTLAVVLLVIKHEVQGLKDELGSLNRQIVVEQETIQVLKAEFAYLSQPDRIRRLASKHLGLQPVAPDQLATFATLDSALAALPTVEKQERQIVEHRGRVRVASRERGLHQ
ncbi:MAG: hypothetical protein HC834_01720 [Rhodospirillales bacterium]|nr:hypothetical protein [Rhodospirillales bacterium]